MTSRRGLLQAALGGATLATFATTRAATDANAGPRIVSVGGALTETLYALGAQRDLVGVDTTSLYPAEARALPSVGYARTLSAEGVLSLRPTLMVATEEAGPGPVLRQLEAAGVRLAVLDGDHRYEGVLARTRRLAGLVGRAAAGETLATSMGSAWQATTEQVARLRSGTSPRVLFVLSFSGSQVRVAGRDSGADAMIRYAGGINAFGDPDRGGFAGYKPLTAEAAIAAAPDVILATDQGMDAVGGIDGVLRLPGLADTPAGKARRVVAMESLLLLGFGPRLPQAVASLAQKLHGSA